MNDHQLNEQGPYVRWQLLNNFVTIFFFAAVEHIDVWRHSKSLVYNLTTLHKLLTTLFKIECSGFLIPHLMLIPGRRGRGRGGAFLQLSSRHFAFSVTVLHLHAFVQNTTRTYFESKNFSKQNLRDLGAKKEAEETLGPWG